jgi:hypothetical protein
MSNYTPTTADFYLMKQHRDDLHAGLAEMSTVAAEALTQLAQIRAVLGGYEDSDLCNLAGWYVRQAEILAALVDSGAVTHEQCVAAGRGLE